MKEYLKQKKFGKKLLAAFFAAIFLFSTAPLCLARDGNVGKKEIKELYNRQSRAGIANYAPSPLLLISTTQTNLGALSEYLRTKYKRFNPDFLQISGVTYTHGQLYSLVYAAITGAIRGFGGVEGADLGTQLAAYGASEQALESSSGEGSEGSGGEGEEGEGKPKEAASETVPNLIIAAIKAAIAGKGAPQLDEEKEKRIGTIQGAFLIVQGKTYHGVREGEWSRSVFEVMSQDLLKSSKSGKGSSGPESGEEDSTESSTVGKAAKASIKEAKGGVEHGTSISTTDAERGKDESKFKSKYANPMLVPVSKREYEELTANGAKGETEGGRYFLYVRMPTDQLAEKGFPAKKEPGKKGAISEEVGTIILDALVVMTDSGKSESESPKIKVTLKDLSRKAAERVPLIVNRGREEPMGKPMQIPKHEGTTVTIQTMIPSKMTTVMTEAGPITVYQGQCAGETCLGFANSNNEPVAYIIENTIDGQVARAIEGLNIIRKAEAGVGGVTFASKYDETMARLTKKSLDPGSIINDENQSENIRSAIDWVTREHEIGHKVKYMQYPQEVARVLDSEDLAEMRAVRRTPYPHYAMVYVLNPNNLTEGTAKALGSELGILYDPADVRGFSTKVAERVANMAPSEVIAMAAKVEDRVIAERKEDLAKKGITVPEPLARTTP